MANQVPCKVRGGMQHHPTRNTGYCPIYHGGGIVPLINDTSAHTYSSPSGAFFKALPSYHSGHTTVVWAAHLARQMPICHTTWSNRVITHASNHPRKVTGVNHIITLHSTSAAVQGLQLDQPAQRPA